MCRAIDYENPSYEWLNFSQFFSNSQFFKIRESTPRCIFYLLMILPYKVKYSDVKLQVEQLIV